MSRFDYLESKQVLIVAYFFPPMGGAGVQRITKFVKYLDRFDWQPYVLSAEVLEQQKIEDTSLEGDLPFGLEVHRTRIFMLPTWLPWRIRDFLTRWLLVVDPQLGWYPFAVQHAKSWLKKQLIQAVISTSAPYTAHLIAMRLKTLAGIPWIADFRDPWVNNFSNTFATPLHESLARRLERKVALAADAVVVVSDPMKQALCERIPGLPAEKVYMIPNGFDPDDFSSLSEAKRPEGKMMIVYNGSFYNQGRTAEAILHGVRQALDNGLVPVGKLLLRFIGNTGKELALFVKKLGLDDMVEIRGYLPHRESLSHLIAADILLLIIGSGHGTEAVYTGKIFEYLAAHKTILCLANDGVASRLIREAQAGTIVPPDDISAISNALGQLYKSWADQTLKIAPDLSVVARFNRQLQTRQLADILNKISMIKFA